MSASTRGEAGVFRVGVLGAGMIASASHGYLAGLDGACGVTVTAIADPATDAAESVASRWRIPRVHSSLEQMIDCDDLDAIVNLTPAPTHYKTTLQSLRAGLHVVSEKPIASTVREADHLIEVAHQVGKHLVVAPVDMLSREWSEAKRLVSSGAIGRLAFGRIRSSHAGAAASPWPTNPAPFYQTGIGPLVDLGPYGVTRVTGVMGPVRRVLALGGITEPFRAVTAGSHAGSRFEVTAPDNVVALLDFGDAVFAMIDTTFNVLATTSPEMEVHGLEGSIAVNSVVPPAGSNLNLSLFRAQAATDFPGWITHQPVSPVEPVDITKVHGRGALVLHLRDCIRDGIGPIASAEHARHVLEVLLAVERAIETGATVDVETTFSSPTQ